MPIRKFDQCRIGRNRAPHCFSRNAPHAAGLTSMRLLHTNCIHYQFLDRRHAQASAQRCLVVCADGVAPREKLEVTIRRKHQQVGQQVAELGDDGVQERLQSAFDAPMRQPYKLGEKIEAASRSGRGVLIAEVCRPAPSSSPEAVARMAQQYVRAGVDAIAVLTDTPESPEGLRDLWVVAQSLPPTTPVLRRDWILHPIQIAETKEAGASGVIGCVAQVLGKGTPIVSGYAAAVGLDAPVEVVNIQEVAALAAAGVPMFGINISVGLSLAVPGAANSIAKGIIAQLPFGVAAVVGCRSVDEVRMARLAGADAMLVKRECMEGLTQEQEQQRWTELQYIVSGDD